VVHVSRSSQIHFQCHLQTLSNQRALIQCGANSTSQVGATPRKTWDISPVLSVSRVPEQSSICGNLNDGELLAL